MGRSLTNKLGSEAADLMAIQHVESTASGRSSGLRTGSGVSEPADDRIVWRSAAIDPWETTGVTRATCVSLEWTAPAAIKRLLKGLGESERLIGPNIRNRTGRKNEQRAAIAGLPDAWRDHMVQKRGGVEAEGGFLRMLGIPGGLPAVALRIGRSIEQKNDRSTFPRAGGISLT